jgi:hypothetical protein
MSRRLVVLAGMILVPVLVAGIALATPGIGILGAPVHARGTLQDESSIRKVGWDLFLSSFGRGDSTDFVTQTITIAAGGTTGWHSHPGPVLVTVKSGSLTVVYANDSSCEGTTYTAGQSFIDFGKANIHTALNKGPVPTELWATYIVPGAAGTTPFRIDAASPGTCNF